MTVGNLPKASIWKGTLVSLQLLRLSKVALVAKCLEFF